MKKSRYEQIANALKLAETGTSVAEALRRMGISEQTFYRWKRLYGGLGGGKLRRLKQHCIDAGPQILVDHNVSLAVEADVVVNSLADAPHKCIEKMPASLFKA